MGAHWIEKAYPHHANSFDVAVRYQTMHAFALMIIGLLMHTNIIRQTIRYLLVFGAGMLLFSGSLYAYTFTDIRFLVHITPLGGLTFLLGWGILTYELFRTKEA